MTAYVAPSPPWRSPWSRAYVVFLWVVTWTSGRASRSANTHCGELNVASRQGLAALLRHERRSLAPTVGHRSQRILSSLTPTKAPNSPSPCCSSTTTRSKRGWMRRPTRRPDDMRTLPFRRESAPREHRSTVKRANPHHDGTHSPSRHQQAPSDRRDRRSDSADR